MKDLYIKHPYCSGLWSYEKLAIFFVYLENRAEIHLLGTNQLFHVRHNIVQKVIKEVKSKYVMIELNEKKYYKWYQYYILLNP